MNIGYVTEIYHNYLTVRGKLKQILKYRNWIAHGRNPNDLPSVPSTDPKTTYETILEFVSQMQGDLDTS